VFRVAAAAGLTDQVPFLSSSKHCSNIQQYVTINATTIPRSLQLELAEPAVTWKKC